MKKLIASLSLFLFRLRHAISGEEDKNDDFLLADHQRGGVLLNNGTAEFFPYLEPEEQHQGMSVSEGDKDNFLPIGEIIEDNSEWMSNSNFSNVGGNFSSFGGDTMDGTGQYLDGTSSGNSSSTDHDHVESMGDGGGGSYDGMLNGLSSLPEDFNEEIFDALQMLPPQLLQCAGIDLESNPLILMGDPIQNKCTEDETTTFQQQISNFQFCTGWDMVAMIEDLPSILVGNGIKCLNMLLSDGVDGFASPQDTKQCIDAFLGENPFASVLHNIILDSDKVCFCYNELNESPLPECTLDVWPIPISGNVISSLSCIISFGCQFSDFLCNIDWENLNTCLPDKNEEGYTCEGIIDKCTEQGSILFPHPYIQIPLPGACRRVYSTQGSNGVIERYDEFGGKCLKESMDIWNKRVDFEYTSNVMPTKSNELIDSSVEFEGANDSDTEKMGGKTNGIDNTKNHHHASENESNRIGAFAIVLIVFSAFIGGAVTALIVIRFVNNRGRSSKYDNVNTEIS